MKLGSKPHQNFCQLTPSGISEPTASLAGTSVSADTMHTQKAMCSQVIETGGDYALTIKDNQSHTRWAIEKLFVNEVANLQKGASLSKDFQMAVKTEKRHGQLEKRTIMTSIFNAFGTNFSSFESHKTCFFFSICRH
jgi:hypothetical protein